MIKLFESNLIPNDPNLPRHSSKGNQLKWNSNGYWYKSDAFGYEGLAEYTCAELLKHSSLDKTEYVLYDTEEIEYKKQTHTGCKSKNFLHENEELVTLERMFKNRYGESFYQSIWKIRGTDERLKFIVNQVEQMTGIQNFGAYISKMFAIDALFLNEDRHMHNIAVIQDDKGKCRLCPFFDNGSALMSDTTMDYPMEEDIYSLIPTVKAKTISTDFDEQLDTAEKLFGRQLTFTFSANDAEKIVYSEAYYSEHIKRRAADIIHEQIRRYPYMFDYGV